MTTGSDDLPIVDAHQHFWDVTLDKHPGFRAEPPPPFRYGDTRPLRHDYLPADHQADTPRHRVVGTVYVETEWTRPTRRGDAVGSEPRRPRGPPTPSSLRRG